MSDVNNLSSMLKQKAATPSRPKSTFSEMMTMSSHKARQSPADPSPYTTPFSISEDSKSLQEYTRVMHYLEEEIRGTEADQH